MYILGYIFLSTLIGKVLSLIIGKGYGFSWLISLIGGTVGAYLGMAVSDAGPKLDGYAWLPSIVGIVVVILIMKLIQKKFLS